MPVAVALVTASGAALPETFALVSVEVVREVGRIPDARLVFEDGDVAAGTFPALDSAELAPGAEISVAVRVEDVTSELFAGQVVRQRLDLAGGAPRLVVECRDKAFRLTRPRRSAVYPDMTDFEAIGAILQRAEVAAGPIGGDAPPPPQAAIVQYDASDWDFILARAEANGLLVTVRDGVVAAQPPSLAGAAALTLTLGMDEIDALELELDATGQHPDVEAVGWDLPGGALTSPAAAQALALEQGNTDPVGTADALGVAPATLAHLAPLPPDELRAWASARLARDRLAMIRGRVGIGGTAAVDLLGLVELAGVGERFGGKALVTGVRHVVEGNGWSTDFQLGFAPDALAAPPDVVNTPANGLLPAARGLAIGLVHGFREDPEGEQRISVVLPGVGAGDGVLWARLATPEAGNGRGFLFRPEVGDEVVIGFLAEDPRQPVVLGALFGSKNPPPPDLAEAAEANTAKGFRTRDGVALTITDQQKPIVALKTPAASFTLDDDAGTLTLADGHDNELRFDDKGIHLKTAGDFSVEASGKVVVKGASVALN